ncbi:hypothetical protein F4779DRAFT_599481 [Xylariaceae sp. FL0662B]|nr:hypothetical protein F4779DRAFT_599481 [Xylariaceae sp. FL0662B]
MLAIHGAITHIFHSSAARDYIDKMFRDMEENEVQSDGSTPLGRFVSPEISGQSSSACV